MKIFVSYCRSDSLAERELFDFFDRFHGWYDQSHTPFVSQRSEGTLCVLLGLVCDLRPDEGGAQSEVFVGLAGEQSLVSFPMYFSQCLEKDFSTTAPSYADDRYAYRNLFGKGSEMPSLESDSLLVGVAPVAAFASEFRYDKQTAWDGSGGNRSLVASADAAKEHLRPPIFQCWDYGSQREDWNSSNPRMSDLLTLLAHALKGACSPTVIQELRNSYRCKLARASIQLEASDRQPARRRIPDFSERISRALADLRERRDLATWSDSFWNNRNFSTRSFGMFPPQYSSLLERRNPFPWSWLQLLTLIAHAGRRTGAALKTYSIPDVLRFRRRRRNAPARGSGRGAGPPTELFPTQTMADLFRGGEGAVLHSYELQQRTMTRLADRKHLLLPIERSLIVPDRDTVNSLFRGGPGRALVRNPGGNT
jgi:hypothetical protein